MITASQIMNVGDYRRWLSRSLKRARKSRCHTQAYLADLLGVRRATLSDWENCKGGVRALPSSYVFYLLEEVYGRAYFTPGR